jgi:hypothetical protein
MAQGESGGVEATLLVDGQPLSIGIANVSEPDHCVFAPYQPETLNTIPDRPITLKLHEGTGWTISITNLVRCSAPLNKPHWDFDLA